MTRYTLDVIPEQPGVYAFHEHDEIICVRSAESLREWIEEDLFTGPGVVYGNISSARIDASRITRVSWWLHPEFGDQATRDAASEMGAEALGSILRERFADTDEAVARLEDEDFAHAMHELFQRPPDGYFVPQSLDRLARRILKLQKRVDELEGRLGGGETD